MDWKWLKDKALELKWKAVNASQSAIEKGRDIVAAAQQKKDEAKDVVSDVKAKKEELAAAWEQKIQDVATTAKEKANAAEDKFESIKWKIFDFSAKAIDMTSSKLSKTVQQVKIMADFEAIKNESFLIILFIKKDDEESKKALLLMPIVHSNIWVNGATFRISDMDDSPDVAKNFWFEASPSIIVFVKWEQKMKSSNPDEVKKFLKDFAI